MICADANACTLDRWHRRTLVNPFFITQSLTRALQIASLRIASALAGHPPSRLVTIAPTRDSLLIEKFETKTTMCRFNFFQLESSGI